MKLLWRSGRRRGKADGKEKEKDIRESRKPWSGITAQKVSIVAVLFLVMYALGALTAKKAESVGVSALLHEKSENWGLGFGTEGKPPTGNASAENDNERICTFLCRGIKKIQCVFYRGYNTEYDLSDI